MSLAAPQINYVMLFPGRTGSTFLTDHLASHPQIHAHYEILSRYQDSWPQQQTFLEGLVTGERPIEVPVIGFKTKLRSVLSLTKFESYLKNFNFRIIHLTRRNHLKFVVSIVRAKMLREQIGDSNLTEASHEALGETIIPLADFAKAKTRLRRTNRITQLIDRLDLPKIEIAYEDLLENERRTLNRVWGFLDVRPIATYSGTRKNTPHDLRTAVTNLDEILNQHPEMLRFVDQL